MNFRFGVDIGGTFTDIILLGGDGGIATKKVLSTPDDYSRGIDEGLRALLAEIGAGAGAIAEFVHGSTIATNTIIERRGVRVALVTTKGFRDVLELGRYRAPRLYDLHFQKPAPLVERRLRFEVPERTDAAGKVMVPVDLDAIDVIAAGIRREGVDAVAVCFINAYVNPANEAAAGERLRRALPGVSVTTSTQLLPQIQEYERTSTTVINAYIRPVVERYVTALKERMTAAGVRAPLTIMQSSGGIIPAHLVAANPVYIIESGPAAGVVGAQRLARNLGLGDLIVLDMGGTTAKATIIKDGQYTILPEGEVGGGAVLGSRLVRGAGYAIQIPTIDIAEVGAGGGSIVTVDVAGGVQVGPLSAGAEPGPICYGRGGTEPTVTDANLLLGYLNQDHLVGGDLRMDWAAAEAAFAALAGRLRQTPTEAAYGVHMLANANMMRAIRGVSVERGSDPADFSLLAIGGNGGVHALGLAETFGMGRVIVPPVAGLFSALGLLFADVEHQLIRPFYRRMETTNAEELNALLAPLIAEAEAILLSEGFRDGASRETEIFIDMKYFAQGATLGVRVPGFPLTQASFASLAAAFEREYMRTFGHVSEGEPQQFVTVKVVARGLSKTPRVPDQVFRQREFVATEAERSAYFGPRHGWMPTPVAPRRALAAGRRSGPLIVEEYDTTTVVHPGWDAALDGWNNIVLTRRGAEGTD